MRVLQVVADLSCGGITNYLLTLYRNINRQKVQFDFLVFREDDYVAVKEIRDYGGRVFYCGLPSLKRVPQIVKATRKILRENGPYQVMHSHANLDNAWILYAAMRENIHNRISHSHGNAGNTSSLFLHKVYDYFKRKLIIYCATDYFACSELAGLFLYGEEKFRILKIGIELSEFTEKQSDDKWRMENSIPLDATVVGNISNFSENKNQTFLVKLFAQWLLKNPNAVLVLGGPDAGALKEVQYLSQQLGISSAIRFIGEQQDVRPALSSMDVFVFPSVYEGFGIVLLEAQAMGLHCIVSNSVSKETDMGLGVMQYLSLKAPLQQWIDAIENALHSPKILSSDGCMALKRHGYSAESNAEELEEIYEIIIKER